MTLGHSGQKRIKIIPITILGWNKNRNKRMNAPRNVPESHYSVVSCPASSAVFIDMIAQRCGYYFTAFASSNLVLPVLLYY